MSLTPFPDLSLSVDGLCVARGTRTVLRDLGFTFVGRQAVSLTGPNGVGKSTLLLTLAGLLSAEDGAITLQIGGQPVELAEQCFLYGHRLGLKPLLTVGENLQFWRDFAGNGRSATVEQALDAVALTVLQDHSASILSQGQQKRLSFARALVAPRPIWLLDEPLASLDGDSQERITHLIDDHRGRGGLALVATHQPLPLAGGVDLILKRGGHS